MTRPPAGACEPPCGARRGEEIKENLHDRRPITSNAVDEVNQLWEAMQPADGNRTD